MTSIDQQQIVAAVRDALDVACDITLRYFRSPVPVDVKPDATPVTLADRETEQAIRELLAQRFPEHGIYGEEQGHTEGSGGTWAIDPIDGTKSFLLGNPLFGSLVGFVRDGRVLAGGMAMPALGEIWIASHGLPTELNGKPVRTRDCTQLGDAALLATSTDFFNPAELERFEAVTERVRYRRFGGDCYTYGMLAGGWCDLVIESDLKPFDFLALIPIVEQAGGVISDWQGGALGFDSGGQVIAAATPELHAAALEILNE